MKEEMKLSGKDLIAIGIFSAIYFVLNFVAMMGGFVPILWILLPGVTAILTAVPFFMMCIKVRKPGAVLIMGAITALLYFVTGQFTMLILVTCLIACVLSELSRYILKYSNSFGSLTISFVLFSYLMLGSPLAIFIYRESFLAQILKNGMAESYVVSMRSLISTPMMLLMLVSPVIGGIIGAWIARTLFNKHFKKAGVI